MAKTERRRFHFMFAAYFMFIPLDETIIYIAVNLILNNIPDLSTDLNTKIFDLLMKS